MGKDTYRGAERFCDVDSADAATLIAYLDEITSRPEVAARKRASYDLLKLHAGMRVLEIGCGTGEDVRNLAALVAPGGRAVGLDASTAMVERARSRTAGEAVEYVHGSADNLPFSAASFDACRAERVFQHLTQPAAAAREMHRVLAPGGRVLLVDQDWETLVISGSEKTLTRRIVNAFCDAIANGWAGRNHYGMLVAAGFTEVAITPECYSLPYEMVSKLVVDNATDLARASGAIDAAEEARWRADLAAADEAGTFFACFTMFLATAVKPAD